MSPLEGPSSPSSRHAIHWKAGSCQEADMSKRVYLLGVGIALLGVGLTVTDWVLSLRPGVTEANVKRIRAGMTVREVEALLGCRAAPMTVSDKDFPLPNICVQEGDEGWALIYVESDGRVSKASWHSFDRTRPGPLDRLRAWLGL